MVLQQLNRISDQIRAVEAKVDRISHKLDDQALAQLKAGINACQNAVELNDPTLRIQMAGQALTTLHAARQFFNQQVVRSAGKAEAAISWLMHASPRSVAAAALIRSASRSSMEFEPVRQVPSGTTYLEQMGTAATADRHPAGTASPRSIGRQGFRVGS